MGGGARVVGTSNAGAGTQRAVETLETKAMPHHFPPRVTGRADLSKTSRLDPERCAKEAPKPGPAIARRLTKIELERSYRALFGALTLDLSRIPSPSGSYGVTNDAYGNKVDITFLRETLTLAQSVATQVERTVASLGAPCDDNARGGEPCAGVFLDSFGERIARRALAADEKASYLELYRSERTAGSSHARGLATLVEALLTSPMFLYRVEAGEPIAGRADGARRLTAWERASALSFSILQRPPDEALLASARSGKLLDPAEYRAQAERLLDSPDAVFGMSEFYSQWLGFGNVAGAAKAVEAFPQFTERVRSDLLGDARDTVGRLAASRDAGTFDRLLTGSDFSTRASTSFLLGVNVTHAEARPAELPERQRAGIITHPAVLAAHSHFADTSPLHMGIFVREQLLCAPLGPPPPNALELKPSDDPNLSPRKKMEQMTSVNPCFACHQYINPLGYGLDTYDPIGRFRPTIGRFPSDTSGTLKGTRDIDGPFADTQEMMARLARSSQVTECFVTQAIRHTYGRNERDDDVCAITRAHKTLTAGGRNLRAMALDVLSSDTFLTRLASK
jgi:hypothetical protein